MHIPSEEDFGGWLHVEHLGRLAKGRVQREAAMVQAWSMDGRGEVRIPWCPPPTCPHAHQPLKCLLFLETVIQPPLTLWGWLWSSCPAALEGSPAPSQAVLSAHRWKRTLLVWTQAIPHHFHPWQCSAQPMLLDRVPSLSGIIFRTLT